MNKYGIAVTAAVLGAIAISVPMGPNYAQTSLLFGLIAAVSAPVVIHKIANVSWVTGMLVGLSIFASSPLTKLFQIDGFIAEMSVILAYGAILWGIGFGWKRRWH